MRIHDLPALSGDEEAHACRVRDALIARIAERGGWLSFGDFMQFALYAPGLGYYSAGARKFGAEGDFVTAPELTPLYARALAGQIVEIFERTGGRELVEFGAGSGALAVDLVRALCELDCAPGRYRIIEVSADLRDRQRARIESALGSLAGRVEWLDTLPATAMRGVVIANEVLDALPVERFLVRDGCVEQLGVEVQGGELVIRPRPADAPLEAMVRSLPVMGEEGYVSEICPLLPAWISAAARLLAAGVLLIVDYGLPRAQYYHGERRAGSLVCHFRQRVHADPLLHIGLQDITAWVDFTAVAEAAAASGLDVLGFTTQAHFLIGCGLDRMLDALPAADSAERRAGLQAVNRLLFPGEMGEAFKVMALGRGVAEPLAGFSVRDLRHTL
jgi:SAM-dependent MidA family methyltransferase